jgi:hypothetical protein
MRSIQDVCLSIYEQKDFFKARRSLKDYKRGEAEDPAVVSDWYARLRNTIDAYGIQPLDIYNMDETGFCIGQGRRVDTIYTRYPDAVEAIHSSLSRVLVTSVECISIDGFVLPPLLIIPGVVQLEEWYTKTNIPDNYIIQTSDTGYTNREMTYLWINHFDLYIDGRRTGAYQLLIFVQHQSHLSWELVEFAW